MLKKDSSARFNHGDCAVCGKPAAGWGWVNPSYPTGSEKREQSRKWFCSQACQKHYSEKRRGKL